MGTFLYWYAVIGLAYAMIGHLCWHYIQNDLRVSVPPFSFREMLVGTLWLMIIWPISVLNVILIVRKSLRGRNGDDGRA